ncbi:uncharacterized protein LOC116620856 isoform X2 [Nematostella vectensis]|uniref:uncharacterized protein LOC116620856 isoform X2 n=1 Tax=Nematostella vectensis TaxID=45351 RepID=UPI001390422A|nr:uncharacterized protein LOC116620856 isoform X2 [Nematostella vectensis]
MENREQKKEESSRPIATPATNLTALRDVRWDVRARADIKLMWQIAMGDGMDIFQGYENGLYISEWTPTESDLKLLRENRPYSSSSSQYIPDSMVFTRHAVTTRTHDCTKSNCFFDNGRVLYL